MRLKIDKFESVAKRYGYKDGYQFIKAMGCGSSTYDYMRYGGKVSPDLLAEIYNRFGEEVMFEVIDFEEY